MEQDPGLVGAILDYRTAVVGKEAFNMPDKSAGFDFLQKNPEIPALLARIVRAQSGGRVDGPDLITEGMGVAEQYREAEDEGNSQN